MTAETKPPPRPVVGEAQSQPHLRRVLGLRDLIIYGLVLLQPLGGVASGYGQATAMSHGHATTITLIALVAMLFTAVSYGRMAALYPAAGSAYTYVGRSVNPYLGFVAGWAMFLDYVIIPIGSLVFATLSWQRLVDSVAPGFHHGLIGALGLPIDEQRGSFVFWIILFTVAITALNLRGIKWTARTNLILTGVMCVVVAIFITQAVRFLWLRQGWAGLISLDPVYDPRTFHFGTVCTATSFAVMTFVGFDGLTTLAEDTKDPKRTVPLALVACCVIIGLCAALQSYLAQRIWPDYSTFKDADTAFFDVCAVVGGQVLFNTVTLMLAVAMVGAAMSGQVGAARLLFAMGRENTIPKFFGRLDKRDNPALNIVLLGILTLVGTLTLDWVAAVTVSNFGAFLGFVGVNLAVIVQFYFRPAAGHQRSGLRDFVCPGLGLLFCGFILVSLPTLAHVVGALWLGLGLLYTGIKTRGFRRPLALFDQATP